MQEPAQEEPADEPQDTPEQEQVARPTMAEEDKADMTWYWDVVEGFDYVSLPLSDELETISAYYAWQNDFNDDPNNAANMQELERRTNVHVDWMTVSTAAATEQFGLMVTSGDWPDIIFGGQAYTGGGVAGLEDEVYLELTDLIAENCPNYSKVMDLSDTHHKATRANDGSIFGFMTVETIFELPFAGVTVFNNLLEDLGFDLPETIADWEAICQAALDNGYAFGYGMMPISCVGNNPYAILTAYNTYGSFYQIDGTIHYGPTEDNFRDALYKLKEWQEKGYLGGDWYGYGDTGMFYQNMFMDQFAKDGGIMCDGICHFGSNQMHAFGNTNPEMYLGAVPNPVLNEGDVNHFRQVVPEIRGGFTAITTTAADPDLCAKWIDYGYTNEGKNLWFYGVEGEDYEMNPDGSITPSKARLGSLNATDPDYDMWREKQAYRCAFATIEMPGFWYEWRSGVMWLDEVEWADRIEINPHIWYDASPADYMLPVYDLMADDLIDGYASTLADITTYVNEMYIKFIIGEADLDTQWEEYVAKIESMNVQFCIDAQQRALDAYNAR